MAQQHSRQHVPWRSDRQRGNKLRALAFAEYESHR